MHRMTSSFHIFGELSSWTITLSLVYTKPKLSPAKITAKAIKSGTFKPNMITMLHINSIVNALIYKAFLVKCASILAKLKFSVIHATDNGNITSPLCNGDKPNFLVNRLVYRDCTPLMT